MRCLTTAAVCPFLIALGTRLYFAATWWHDFDFMVLNLSLRGLLTVVAIVLTGFIVVGIVHSLWHRRWQHFIIYSLVPPIALTSLLAGGAIAPSIKPWELRFWINHNAYDRETARATDANGGPDLMCFDWGEGGWALSHEFFYLVFDSSDEIARATTARSAQWVAQFNVMLDKPCLQSDDVAIKSKQQYLLEPVIEIKDEKHVAMIKPLGAHFYFVWTHY